MAVGINKYIIVGTAIDADKKTLMCKGISYKSFGQSLSFLRSVKFLEKLILNWLNKKNFSKESQVVLSI